MKNLVVLAASIVLSASTLYGQTLGAVTGRVTDPSASAIPGATITLTNVSTNAERTTVSTDDGDYTLPSVPPGVYNLKVEHAGFASATSNNVEVQVQQTVRADFTLKIGQVSESVEVSAAAAHRSQSPRAASASCSTTSLSTA